ncbi:diacylglycerol/lipid kinase family protein [Fusobacterium sp. PH5-44]|uniref:diacylglycerol/lipid kinase family protein n=1 Tax=unclassified Fusobacterium TaxID=2648384 RepID=UPI003D24A634
MKKLLFIFNPKAGKGKVKENLVEIFNIFIRAGYRTEVYPTKVQLDGKEYALNYGRNYDMIVCAGGDGTLNEVSTAMFESKLNIPMGYIPTGSTNDFAYGIGLSKEILEAANKAVNGIEQRIDMGKFNNKSFVYIAAFGAFTDIAYTTSQGLKNILGHQAYLLEGAKKVMSIKAYKQEVSWEDERGKNQVNGEFIYGMVSNSKSVGGFKSITGNDVRLDDGLYEVTLIKKIRNPLDLKDIIMFLLGNEVKNDIIIKFKSEKVRFVSDDIVHWTLDGEFGGSYTDVKIENVRKALGIKV